MKQVGLYKKFIVRRVDGGSRKGRKHEKCKYFVLDITHDKYAEEALIAYAEACNEEHPELAEDILNKRWDRIK
jgi:hypothetical protein